MVLGWHCEDDYSKFKFVRFILRDTRSVAMKRLIVKMVPEQQLQ